MFVEGQEILEKRYTVIKRLGSGAFGEIFKGKLIKTWDFLHLKLKFSWKKENRRISCC